ncbi:nitrous oxide-stimulated promoter family protein [Propionivibrio limicola]|uniref:nitrous oxide-stimulated promoter family protein n=1 Tax=Propionivibrio limicola TaxID=167645 RepID=UPI001B864C87|nr:nitrous oxide-stimulated promoter family protein [Propionivibrio limicola]
MSKQVIDFITDPRYVRRAREQRTIAAMLRMYCHAHGHGADHDLCPDCARLLDYATRRLERCIFGDAKPTCANCLVHCYSADLREQMRIVMRWTGPRMLKRHPILGILHLLDGRRPSIRLPEKPQKSQKV